MRKKKKRVQCLHCKREAGGGLLCPTCKKAWEAGYTAGKINLLNRMEILMQEEGKFL